MKIEPTSTVRARRLRERRSRGIAMVAPVEVGEGGIELLVSNGLLKQHQTRDRQHMTGETPALYVDACQGLPRPCVGIVSPGLLVSRLRRSPATAPA
jgi:hypothetical protein